MRRPFVLAALAVCSLAAPASAQVLGLPVYNHGVGSGISVNGDVAYPNDEHFDAEGTVYAVTGAMALGPIGLTATMASSSPHEGESHSTFGGTANFKLFGGPLIPIGVNFQAGAAWTTIPGANFGGVGDLDIISVPVGIGVSATIPTPGVSIKPWIAPRMQYTRSTGDVDDSATDFGLSAGVNLGLLMGLNARVAYDYINTDTGRPTTWSFGLGWNFNVPGLPGI
jgi:opacity protein-like surface antigen